MPRDSIYVNVSPLLSIGIAEKISFIPSESLVIVKNLASGNEIRLKYLKNNSVFGESQGNFKIEAGETYRLA
ncbi:MAG: hypothetical protein EOO90_26045 [Pedobacter sp.]|nr:MAG: hypothetical protein EOO90_26045 [Pedobacter sp.]